MLRAFCRTLSNINIMNRRTQPSETLNHGTVSGSLQPPLTFGDLLSLLRFEHIKGATLPSFKPQSSGCDETKWPSSGERIFGKCGRDGREMAVQGWGWGKPMLFSLTPGWPAFQGNRRTGSEVSAACGIRSLIYSSYAQHGPEGTFWTERTHKQPLSSRLKRYSL